MTPAFFSHAVEIEHVEEVHESQDEKNNTQFSRNVLDSVHQSFRWCSETKEQQDETEVDQVKAHYQQVIDRVGHLLFPSECIEEENTSVRVERAGNPDGHPDTRYGVSYVYVYCCSHDFSLVGLEESAVAVGNGLVDEDDRKRVIATLQKPVREVLASVKEEQLHNQSGSPKDCNESANGTCLEAFARSHGFVVDYAHDAKGKDGQDDEYTVYPEKGAKEWDELSKFAFQVERFRYHGRGNQGQEMEPAAGED